MTQLSPHVAGFITPLCDATTRLLSEVTGLDNEDFVEISLDERFVRQDESLRSKHFVVYFKHSGIPSWRMRSNWWHRIPGAQATTSVGYGFTAPPTDISALIILAALGKERISFADDTARMTFWTCAMRFAKQTRVARAQAGYKQYASVPHRAPRGRKGLPPMAHQAVAGWCASLSEGYGLWMEQSTGKTYTAILAVEESIREKCQRVAIVCPKNLRLNWEVELGMFSSKRIATFRLEGGAIDREKILLDAFRAQISGDYDIVYVIVSYQSFVNSQRNVCAYPWDWAILDEGHFIKVPGRERTKACLKLRDVSKRKLELTGTPITNHAFDLYTQLEFLGEGYSGFTSFDQFKRFYGVWEPAGHGIDRLQSMQNVPLLKERIARLGFSITKKEALPNLPDKSYEIIGVDMTPVQRTVYDALATQLYAEIESALASGDKTITVNNVLVRLLRLAQITSGFAALDREIDPETEELGPQMIDRFDPNPKLEELVEFLKDLQITSPESKVIIWCCFIQDIKSIAARLRVEEMPCVTYYGKTSDTDRDEAVERFNNDSTVNYFIGNPAAGGVGLNLTGAGCWPMRTDLVIFYSQNWSSVLRSQGEERPRGFLHESVSPTGKREHWQIRCVDLCVEDSIDVQIRQRVTDKRLNAAKLQDVRELLQNLIGKSK